MNNPKGNNLNYMAEVIGLYQANPFQRQSNNQLFEAFNGLLVSTCLIPKELHTIA